MEGVTMLSAAEYRQLVEERMQYRQEADDLQNENEDLHETVTALMLETEKLRKNLEEAQKAIKDSGVIYWYERCKKLERDRRAAQEETSTETQKEAGMDDPQ